MKFSKEQTVFLKDELGINLIPDEEAELSYEEWLAVQDKVFMIEAEEARPDGAMNERCRLAVEICDKKYRN